jgi:hypothetical protein
MGVSEITPGYVATIRTTWATGRPTVGHLKRLFHLTSEQGFAILYCSDQLTDEQIAKRLHTLTPGMRALEIRGAMASEESGEP